VCEVVDKDILPCSSLPDPSSKETATPLGIIDVPQDNGAGDGHPPALREGLTVLFGEPPDDFGDIAQTSDVGGIYRPHVAGITVQRLALHRPHKTESTSALDCFRQCDENALTHHRIDDRIYHLVTSVEGVDRDVLKLYQTRNNNSCMILLI
jgi:hypothetical protein